MGWGRPASPRLRCKIRIRCIMSTKAQRRESQGFPGEKRAFVGFDAPRLWSAGTHSVPHENALFTPPRRPEQSFQTSRTPPSRLPRALFPNTPRDQPPRRVEPERTATRARGQTTRRARCGTSGGLEPENRSLAYRGRGALGPQSPLAAPSRAFRPLPASRGAPTYVNSRRCGSLRPGASSLLYCRPNQA